MLSLYVPGGSWIPQGVRGKSVFQKALPLAPYSSQQRSDMCGGGDWNSKEHPKKPNKPGNLNQIRTKTKNPNLGNTSEKPKICCTPSGGVQSSPTKGISKDWTPLLYLVCHVELCAIFFFSVTDEYELLTGGREYLHPPSSSCSTFSYYGEWML